MRPKNVPAPVYPFAFVEAPTSGNEINGLGLKDKVRPRKIAPEDFTFRVAWHSLWNFIICHWPWSMFRRSMELFWIVANGTGAVSSRQTQVSDRDEMASLIKDKAIALGAGIAGITIVRDDLLLYEEQDTCPYQYAISMAFPMDREEMLSVPSARAGTEIMKAYRTASNTANELAAYIRSLGWPAEAFGFGRDVLHIPTAIEAGIGQLGKHGSLISKEFGSNMRLAMVLTDLPMAIDSAMDIGIEDVCATCQACTKQCPPDAISDKKQMVRGIEKWYVDYDKCIPYFAMNYGCGICLEVCPWSEPGRGVKLSEMILKRRKA